MDFVSDVDVRGVSEVLAGCTINNLIPIIISFLENVHAVGIFLDEECDLKRLKDKPYMFELLLKHSSAKRESWSGENWVIILTRHETLTVEFRTKTVVNAGCHVMKQFTMPEWSREKLIEHDYKSKSFTLPLAEYTALSQMMLGDPILARINTAFLLEKELGRKYIISIVHESFIPKRTYPNLMYCSCRHYMFRETVALSKITILIKPMAEKFSMEQSPVLITTVTTSGKEYVLFLKTPTFGTSFLSSFRTKELSYGKYQDCVEFIEPAVLIQE